MSMIYFIRAAGLGCVKIGTANDVEKRRSSLQCGCPAPLEIVGVLPGGQREERRIHSALRYHWRTREWFDEQAAILFYGAAKLVGLDRALAVCFEQQEHARVASAGIGKKVRALLVNSLGNGRHLPEAHKVFAGLSRDRETLDEVLAHYGLRSEPYLPALNAIVRQADELRGAA